MKDIDHRIEYLKHQMESERMQVLYWNASVVTGYYKQRDVTHLDGSKYTDENKLGIALSTMQNHIHIFSGLLDKLAELQTEKENNRDNTKS